MNVSSKPGNISSTPPSSGTNTPGNDAECSGQLDYTDSCEPSDSPPPDYGQGDGGTSIGTSTTSGDPSQPSDTTSPSTSSGRPGMLSRTNNPNSLDTTGHGVRAGPGVGVVEVEDEESFFGPLGSLLADIAIDYVKDAAIGAAVTGLVTIAAPAVATVAVAVVTTVAVVKVVRAAVRVYKATTSVAKKGKEYGSYTNTHFSGRRHHGQGDRRRSQTSGREKAAENNDPHTATDWTSAPNRREAMKDEARRIENDGGVDNPNNYNKINSPGKNYIEQDGG